MSLIVYPWQNKEKPYWINPENGLEWYIDKDLTKYCSEGDLPKLNAVVFYVVEKSENDFRKPITRLLVDIDTNKPLADYTALEAMCYKIDSLRLSKNFENKSK